MSNYLIIFVVMQLLALLGMLSDYYLHGDRDVFNIVVNNQVTIAWAGAAMCILTMEVFEVWP